MSTLLVNHAAVIRLDVLQQDHSVYCENGVIKNIAPTAELTSQPADQVIDAGGAYLAPGFIDLHFHGVHEHLMDDGPEHFEAITRVAETTGVQLDTALERNSEAIRDQLGLNALNTSV